MQINNKKIFEKLYQDIDGMRISLEARNKLSYQYIGHTYGEVTYEGFWEILKLLDKNKRGVFYDLGSGTGKPVIIASLMGFKTSIGIEEMKDLHDTAENVLLRYKSEFKDNLEPEQEIKFICADFADVDFTDADVVFMNATCFEYEFTPSLFKKFDNLKKGAIILTTSIGIPFPSYQIRTLGEFPFTWDFVEVFIHQKQ